MCVFWLGYVKHVLLIYMPPRTLHYILELSNYSLLGEGLKLCPLSQTKHWLILNAGAWSWACLHPRAVHRQRAEEWTYGSVLPQGSDASELQPTGLHQLYHCFWNSKKWKWTPQSIKIQFFLLSFMLLKWLADVLAVTALAEHSWDYKSSSQSD